MVLNRTETLTNASWTKFMSMASCAHSPELKWDLNDSTTRWALATVISIACPSTVVLNTLVIVILKKEKESQKSFSILLFSLAITDLLVGAICMPLDAVSDLLIFGQVSIEKGCTATLVLNILASASLIHLAVIPWERYVAIRKWINYKTILTERRMKKLVAISWLSAIVLGFSSSPPKPGWTLLYFPYSIKSLLNLVTAFGLPIAIFYFYLMVYLGILQRKKSMINQTPAARAELKLQSKVAKTCAMITFTLFITYIQQIVITMLAFFKSPPFYIVSSVFRWSDLILQLNSLLNPLIYCFTRQRFRSAVLELMIIKKPRAIQPTTDAVLFEKKTNRLEPVVKKVVQQQQLSPVRSASWHTCTFYFKNAYSTTYRDKPVLKRSVSAPSFVSENNSIDNCI